MNYLIRTPRKEFDYEPAFQCHPLRCPPVPPGHDVVVPCDTDARMNWEWYYMRDDQRLEAGKDVEAASTPALEVRSAGRYGAGPARLLQRGRHPQGLHGEG